MKVLLFLLIVLIAVSVFLGTYESQHAVSLEQRQDASAAGASLEAPGFCHPAACSQPGGPVRGARSA